MRKVFNPVGVVFKGSGFYRTDSRNGSKSHTDGDSGSSDKRSETKPAETKSADKESAGASRSVQRQRQGAGIERDVIHNAETRRQLALWTTRMIWMRVLNVQA